MGVLNILDPVFDATLGPVISLPPFWAVLIISFLVSLLITVIYKWMTDQDLMKQLKDEMKELQNEMKELKEDPKKVMVVQKKAMETNMKYMTKSMKPTLVTFIPIILIFAWLSAHLGFEPLMPGQDFSVEAEFLEGITGTATITAPEGLQVTTEKEQEIVTGKARWGLKGDAGDYFVEITKGDATVSKKLTITSEQTYAPQMETYATPPFKEVQTDQKKLIVLNLFGWELGWLGAYIIFSIICSMILRKLMKVY